ncbi:MAG: hydrogenase formation protein HypD [Magnetococcales bacterium]|nr:hydrogenase formation protein HypD [Magnetococcales bacterium]
MSGGEGVAYIDAFRDGAAARGLAQCITAEVEPGRRYRFMEFCGGHTHAIFRFGLMDLLPPEIQLVHGPGCPVCVLPSGRLKNALELAHRPGVILTSYADMMRVPTPQGETLLKAKAAGCDVRMIYSAAESLELARRHPQREVIFFAIGFETTAPPTAVVARQAHQEGLKNFSIFCNHVLTPPAIRHILEAPEIRESGAPELDGFIGPAHVSAVIGTQPYEYFAEEYAKPVVVAGFEPLDVLQAVRMLVRQVNEGRSVVENEYSRAVTREGNLKAQGLIADLFEMRRRFEWRGLGMVPYSALRLRGEFAQLDAERRFGVEEIVLPDPAACQCGSVLRGIVEPPRCKVFGTACTPEHPIGACMVSSEGACAAYFSYGRRPASD